MLLIIRRIFHVIKAVVNLAIYSKMLTAELYICRLCSAVLVLWTMAPYVQCRGYMLLCALLVSVSCKVGLCCDPMPIYHIWGNIIAGIHLEKDMPVPFGHTVARTVCLFEMLCAPRSVEWNLIINLHYDSYERVQSPCGNTWAWSPV